MMRPLPWLLLLGLAGCASAPAPQLVSDRLFVLGRQQNESLPLAAGRYRLELTASADGVDLEWLGGVCLNIKAARHYAADCQLTQAGQLALHNPALFSLQGESHVTVRLLRLDPQQP